MHNRWGDPVHRFWTKVAKSAGCWEWTGYVMPNGYGCFRVRHAGRTFSLAHRFSYTIAFGPIQDGLQIDHLCRNRRCVRPDHLEAVTARVNILRGENQTAVNARKDRCPRGHPLDGRLHNGKRYCLTCNRLASVALRKAIKTGERPKLNSGSRAHCPKGHPYDAENTYYAVTGTQRCKTCHRATANRRRNALRAEKRIAPVT